MKLSQLTYSFRDVLTTNFAVSITLVSPSWFWYSIVSSAVYFGAQNLLHFQINKSDMGNDLDSTIISFTAVQTLFTCFIFSAIAYAKFHS